MSKLQILYSKELAKELGKIAVYLPGEQVVVGDIITFPNGNSFLGKSRPLGTFKKITSLQNLGLEYKEPSFSKKPDTYRFSSKNAVNFNFDVGTNADLGNEELPSGKANVKINFTNEGAIYFLAVDCDKKELNDLSALEKQINDKGRNLLWKNTYLVTSVTVAKKAFIAQSRSKSSELVIQSSLKGVQSGQLNLKADANVSLSKQQGDVFIKDWSDDVTVFMDLIKFEEEIFGKRHRGNKVILTDTPKTSRIVFKTVSIKELLTD